MPVIKTFDLCRTYRLNGREIAALKDFNVRINHGEFATVVGKSGCGKTTLLRLLCGLEKPSRGNVSFFGADNAPTQAKIGVVFQESRLMPWLTVEKNMAFGLDRRLGAKRVREIVDNHLEMLGLTAFRDAYPSQISGGMAQRAALGRTLCADPDVILMDEPFGALDAFTRRNLQEQLTQIFLNQSKTIIFVTHDVDEAIFLGQRVLVLERGEIKSDVPVPLKYPRSMLEEKLLRIREQLLSVILAR